MELLPDLLAIDGVMTVVVAWFAIGFAGLASMHDFRVVGRVLFPVSAALSLALAGFALTALPGAPQSTVLAIGLPDLPFHLRLDALSAFFLAILGLAGAGISIFAGGYFRQGEGTPPGLLCLHYHVFMAAMAMVLLADDAYAFMVTWEVMALSSYFLVTTNHRIAEIRRAGFLYLLVAHIGAIAILLCFGVLQANTGDYTSPTCARSRSRPSGPRPRSCWRSSASARRRGSCRCTCGCRRRTPPRPRRCRPS